MTRAIHYLDKGQEEQAKEEISSAYVLITHPTTKHAQSKRLADLLSQQIALDPYDLLGTESFEYTIKRDDTLSKLSRQYLEDTYMFYALAKYNNISNPNKILAGDEIRIPGVRKASRPNPSPNGPKVQIFEPMWLCREETYIASNRDRVDIHGFYKSRSGVKKIYVNGRQINFDEEGRFSHSLRLTKKENRFELYAIDEHGQESERCRTRILTGVPRRKELPRKQQGKYYALVIGNSHYDPKEWSILDAPVDDANAVARLLHNRYGFQLIPPLFDPTRGRILIDATRDEIINTLFEVRNRLTRDDHLLVYYAGHGSIDNKTAYWVPVNSTKEPGQWITIDYILSEMLKPMRAKHVLVVSDSCFAGAIAMTPPGLPQLGAEREAKLNDILRKRSRTVLVAADGATETPDHLGERHSPFAKAFIDVLNQQNDPLLGEELFKFIRQEMRGFTKKYRIRPGYKAIQGAGHEVGGDFLFVPQRPATS